MVLRVGLLLFGFAFGSACSTPETDRPSPKSRPFEIEGHRGARGARPENTLAAFRYALAEGADTLEMDLHATQDGVLVVTHDPTIDPDLCRGPDGKRPAAGLLVSRLTLNQVESYDCGSIPNRRFSSQVAQPGERIPTFESVLAWLSRDPNPRAKKLFLNVETKSEEAHPEYAPPPREFAAKIIALTKRYGVFDRLILQSFDYRTLRAAREIDPKTILSVLIQERPAATLAEIATELHAEIVSPNYAWLSGVDVESLHVLGIRVVPWTVNTERDWRRLANLGVDGIITDDPKGLFEFRRRYFTP